MMENWYDYIMVTIVGFSTFSHCYRHVGFLEMGSRETNRNPERRCGGWRNLGPVFT